MPSGTLGTGAYADQREGPTPPEPPDDTINDGPAITRQLRSRRNYV